MFASQETVPVNFGESFWRIGLRKMLRMGFDKPPIGNESEPHVVGASHILVGD
jgi:hypothetical protein